MRQHMIGLGLLSMLVLTSCSQPNTEETKAQFCKDLAAFQQSVATMQGISANSTVGALKDAQRQVEASFKQVKESAAKVNAAKVDELETALNNLTKAINNISDKTTLREAATSIQDEVQAVSAARSQLSSVTQCTP